MRTTLRSLFVLFVALLIVGCAGGTLTVEESYDVLRPVKQLDLPEQVSENLIIKISNVADERSSYKNRVEAFINDKKIEPNWLISNIENTYTYSLRVRPGYYKVKSYYYAYVGWGEEKYLIETHDLVAVLPGKITTVSCDIVKEDNGVPVNKKMYFKQEAQPIKAGEQD
ncbi:hypothetical protein A2V82_14100 [candidate division KSB1 bacterium RBG_16_48_16]|nr:MAG: hypothetical protein A2V82_14100 [candidate division KSB1 bacterium RBG_16_48_16]